MVNECKNFVKVKINHELFAGTGEIWKNQTVTAAILFILSFLLCWDQNRSTLII